MRPQPDLAVPRQSTRESARPFISSKVLIGAGVEGRPERVEHARLRARAFDHGIHQRRLELRLGEHARRVELFEPLVDLAQPPRARTHRGVDGDRADGFHPVAVLEILVGIVEHDVGPIGNGGEPVLERAVEFVQLLAQTLGIGLVGRSIARVRVAERGRDRGREHLGVAGIEPDVHVGLAVRMVRGLVLGLGMLAVVAMLGVLGCAVIGIGAGMLVAVLVRFPHAAFARRKEGQAGRLPQLDDLGVAGQRLQRLDQEGLHRLADPEHHLGLLEGAGCRRPQTVAVLGAGALDQQDRLADALHHAGDQRMHGLDAGHDVDLRRRDRPACAGHERQQRNRSDQTAVEGCTASSASQ